MLDSRRPTANPVRLDQFEGVLQAESEWCWAAATASIFNYYASRSSGTRATVARQCRFVPYLEPGVAHPCLRYDKDEPLRECRASGCANPFANMPEDLQFELSRYGLLECEKIPFDGVARACGGRVVQGWFRSGGDLGHDRREPAGRAQGERLRLYGQTGVALSCCYWILPAAGRPADHLGSTVGARE